MTITPLPQSSNDHEHEHPTTGSATGSVYTRMARVAAEAHAIRKDGFNKFHNYAYVSKDTLFAALKPLLDKHGLAIVPSIESVTQILMEHKGNPATITRAHMSILVACEEGHAVFSWCGDGQDAGDKAVSKAAANAMKSWLINAFQIPAGDDDEPIAPASSSKDLEEAHNRMAMLARIADLQAQAHELKIDFVKLGMSGVPLNSYDHDQLVEYGKALRAEITATQAETPDEDTTPAS